MKTLQISVVALATVAMVGCTQDETLTQQSAKTYTAVVENTASTRSYNAGGGAFKWSAGDDIAVYTEDGGFKTMAMTGGADTDVAQYGTFFGDPKDVAVFPVSSATSYTGGTLIVSYPSEYNVTTETKDVDDPMVAYFEEGDEQFHFHHVGGVIEWTVNVPSGVDAFEVTMNSGVTGNFVVNSSDKNAPTVTTTGAENNVVTFKFAANEKRTKMHFYMPVPTGTYEGLKIAIKKGDTEVGSYTSTATNSVNRCDWIKMPTISMGYTGVIESTIADGAIVDGNGTKYESIAAAINSVEKNGSITIKLGKGTYIFNEQITGSKTVTIQAGDGLKASDVTIDGQLFTQNSTVNVKNVTLDNSSAPEQNRVIHYAMILGYWGATFNIEGCILNNNNSNSNATMIGSYWVDAKDNPGLMKVTVKNSIFNMNGRRPVQLYGNTDATFENCTFNNQYRYVVAVHGGGNTVTWNNNTVTNDGKSNKDYYGAIEVGTSASDVEKAELTTPDKLIVSGGTYPSDVNGKKFYAYYRAKNAINKQQTITGTMPDGSTATIVEVE